MTGPACTWDADGVEVSPIQQRAVMRELRRALVDPELDGVVLGRALHGGQWKEGFDSAVECVDARIEHLTGHIEGLAAAVPPVPFAASVGGDPGHGARATTPGDDRGRELAELVSLADTAIGVAEQTVRDGKTVSREVVAEWRAALDRLRALAAPAETEAGDAERDVLAVAMEPKLRQLRGYADSAVDVVADALARVARARLAATPPAPEGEAVRTAEVIAWHRARFGGDPADVLVMGKLAEEAGEVCGAITKRAEGAVRPAKGLVTREDWSAHLLDEVGDVGIVLHTLCGREGTSLDEVVTRRFRDDVSLRTGQETTTPGEQCPSCTSPRPERHPAVQEGGEVQLCPDPFHATVTAENTAERVAALSGDLWTIYPAREGWWTPAPVGPQAEGAGGGERS